MRTFLWYSSRLRCASPICFNFAQQVIDDTGHKNSPADSPISPKDSSRAQGAPGIRRPPHHSASSRSQEHVRFSARRSGAVSLPKAAPQRHREHPLACVVWARARPTAPRSTAPVAVSRARPGGAHPMPRRMDLFLESKHRGIEDLVALRRRVLSPRKPKRTFKLPTVGCSGSLHAAQPSQRLDNFPGPLSQLILPQGAFPRLKPNPQQD